jgi:cell division protein FtsZ
VDAIIIIPNDKILAIVNRDTGVKNAFAMCDDILKQAVEGIADLITTTGIINVDFADVRAIMQNAGSALMGIGTAIGEKRAEAAARAAINSPLLDVSITGAKGVLFSIAGGDDLGMLEIQDAANVITEAIDPEAKVIFGAVVDEELKKGQVRVTVIATGFPETQSRSGAFPAAAPQRLSLRKNDDMTPLRAERKPPVVSKEEKVPEPELKKETPSRPAEPMSSEDEDAWGGLPAFLRRK